MRLKGEYLNMHDHDGKLLVKARRSKIRLYNVCMGIKESMGLLMTAINESNRWHVRLGHINLETMKAMIQRELVVGIPQIIIEKEVCGLCLLGKQTRQSFPQSSMYRATKLQELVHVIFLVP